MDGARRRPRARLIAAVLSALTVTGAGCAGRPATPAATDEPATTVAAPTSSPAATAVPLTDALRQWQDAAGDHFTESAQALKEVADASAGGDEAALESGCSRLHDTNTLGLQGHLPTPDPELTDELQRMIDDINTATHACLRFAATRGEADAANYRDYLARAIQHLNRAKGILDGDLAPK